MININTGSEVFTAYAFDVQGFLGNVMDDSIDAVLDGTAKWSNVDRVDVYVTNDQVEGLWVGKYSASGEEIEINPQVEVTV